LTFLNAERLFRQSIRLMETDPDILAIARAALAQFGAKAADCMDRRAKRHEMAGEEEGSILWRRVAAAVREGFPVFH
jgi:hypothetical protein